jgi:pyruvate,water dikinase
MVNKRIIPKRKVLLKGYGASGGVASGSVRVLFDPSQAAKELKFGDILVVSMTDPNWTVFMRKAGAIITNTGGLLCHAAIVAREMSIPCVTGTMDATEKLRNGQKVIVDGYDGIVYEGSD